MSTEKKFNADTVIVGGGIAVISAAILFEANYEVINLIESLALFAWFSR